MDEMKNYLEVIDMPYANMEDKQEKNKIIEIELSKEETEESESSEKKDTSFKTYNEEKKIIEKTKRKSWMSRIRRLCLRVVVTIIAIPIIVLGGGMTVGITGMGFFMGIGSILVGIGAMAMAAFTITAYSELMGLLGVFIALGLLSSGGLILCLMIMLTKGLKRLVKMIRQYIRGKVEEE